MSEIVTPPAVHAIDAIHYLFSINNVLRSALSPGELLWPLSMPPKLPTDMREVRIANASPKKEAYLKAWFKRYGLAEGTPCGAHINLSIDPHIIDLVMRNFPAEFANKVAVKN